MEPVKICLTNSLTKIYKKYFLTIIDKNLKGDFVIEIPAKVWRGRFTDFTVEEWEQYTGRSFY